MDSDSYINMLKKDPFLAPRRCVHPVQVSKNGKSQLSQQLNTIEKELVKQPELFEGEN